MENVLIIDEEKWRILAESIAALDRSVYQRLIPDSNFDVFYGLEMPGSLRYLSIHVHGDWIRSFKIKSTKVITAIMSLHDEGDKIFTELRLTLRDIEASDVFNSLCSDLVNSLLDCNSDFEALQSFSTRYLEWIKLLAGRGSLGLGPEEQQGLYGELYLIENIIFPFAGAKAISNWTGPDRSKKDFIFNSVGIEVKTTKSSGDGKVKISSAGQLSDIGFGALILAVLKVDQDVAKNEDTIITIADRIGNALRETGDLNASEVFEEKLFQFGLIRDEIVPESLKHFKVISTTYYEVADQFPRITENEIPPGLSEISYSVSLAACEAWKRPNNWILEIIEN